MNLGNGSEQSYNNKTTKAKAAMAIAGIFIAVTLMSGLLSIIGSETAIAQENMTATNATGIATIENATNPLLGNATAS